MGTDTHQHERRAESLREAMGRISEVRMLRRGEIPAIADPDELPANGASPRRGLFSFSSRARAAVNGSQDQS